MSAQSSPFLSDDDSDHRSETESESESESQSLDMISHLPDGVIQQILSYLTTKDAVATSVLSWRWRYIWELVPNLKFDNSKAYTYDERFSDLVNNALMYHGADILEKFHLKCSPYDDFEELESWVDCAVERCPREVKLSMCSFPGRHFAVPASVLNCETITVLKLKGEGIFVDVRDTYVQLPCLKVLNLFFVHYIDDSSLTGLLSGCRALEEIHFRRSFYHDNIKTLCINVPTLRRLVLVCPKTFVTSQKLKLEIKAPALEYLELRAVQCQDLLVEEFPQLVKATLDFCEPLTGKLLGSLRNVKQLCLDNLPKSLPQEGLNLIPEYHQLEGLEFTLVDSVWGVLMDLLENSPKLKALVIRKDERIPPLSHCSFPKSLPNCFLYQLETLCVHGFTCSEGEMSFVRDILEKGEALKRVYIHTFSSLMDYEAKQCLIEQLSALPKSSASCEIDIV
ncbi:PREDICTED: F-box/FBD/LRR-repeat protein At5g56420-like [Tarenaya hassleriana]|uniref:F-box/FBD/LRR-repeat protein At5g56420-like n=1 Tax=Tarenaya hassleriana TaxID=28532 RepID=UPI00053C1D22|nr:PREDICTED: F-box/FBD/LRR-repeat protein At5g56420-like [Tarenaya hassleriana]